MQQPTPEDIRRGQELCAIVTNVTIYEQCGDQLETVVQNIEDFRGLCEEDVAVSWYLQWRGKDFMLRGQVDKYIIVVG